VCGLVSAGLKWDSYALRALNDDYDVWVNWCLKRTGDSYPSISSGQAKLGALNDGSCGGVRLPVHVPIAIGTARD
jgi:hypothetical protein